MFEEKIRQPIDAALIIEQIAGASGQITNAHQCATE
jgi:hypothetical protein